MCERTQQVQAYHDRQLTPAERTSFESHLARCELCQQELEQLQQISRLFVDVPLPQMRDEFARQIVFAWRASRQSQEQGLRRLAGWLTAAAAVVLLGAIIQFGFLKSNQSSKLEAVSTSERDWDLTAVMPPLHVDDTGTADLVQVAQWMARDLSPQEGR